MLNSKHCSYKFRDACNENKILLSPSFTLVFSVMTKAIGMSHIVKAGAATTCKISFCEDQPVNSISADSVDP